MTRRRMRGGTNSADGSTERTMRVNSSGDRVAAWAVLMDVPRRGVQGSPRARLLRDADTVQQAAQFLLVGLEAPQRRVGADDVDREESAFLVGADDELPHLPAAALLDHPLAGLVPVNRV